MEIRVAARLVAGTRGRRGAALPVVGGVLLLTAGIAGFAATLPADFGLTEGLPLASFATGRGNAARPPATPGTGVSVAAERPDTPEAEQTIESMVTVRASGAMTQRPGPASTVPNGTPSNSQPQQPTATPTVGATPAAAPAEEPGEESETPTSPVESKLKNARAATILEARDETKPSPITPSSEQPVLAGGPAGTTANQAVPKAAQAGSDPAEQPTTAGVSATARFNPGMDFGTPSNGAPVRP